MEKWGWKRRRLGVLRERTEILEHIDLDHI